MACYHIVEWPASAEKSSSVSVIPDKWLVEGSSSCYWPPSGSVDFVRQCKNPASSWQQHPYLRVLKSSSSWTKILKYEQAYMQFSEVETEQTDLDSNTIAGSSKKRRRVPIKRWSPDRDEPAGPEDLDDGDSSCSSTSNSQPSPPPRKISRQQGFGNKSISALQAVTPSRDRARHSPSVSRAAPLSPPQRNSATFLRNSVFPSQNTPLNARTCSRDSQKDMDYTPYFEAVLTAVERNSAALQQLRCEVNDIRKQLNRMETGLKATSEGEELHQPGFPDDFRFPLHSLEELEQLNALLSTQTGVQKSMVRAIGNFGGSTVKQAVEEAGKRLLRPELTIKFNMLGRKGKHSFNILAANVKGTMLAGVRSRHADLDDKTFSKYLGHWFSGSGDRLPGGRKFSEGRRQEEEKPEQAEEEDEGDEN